MFLKIERANILEIDYLIQMNNDRKIFFSFIYWIYNSLIFFN